MEVIGVNIDKIRHKRDKVVEDSYNVKTSRLQIQKEDSDNLGNREFQAPENTLISFCRNDSSVKLNVPVSDSGMNDSEIEIKDTHPCEAEGKKIESPEFKEIDGVRKEEDPEGVIFESDQIDEVNNDFEDVINNDGAIVDVEDNQELNSKDDTVTNQVDEGHSRTDGGLDVGLNNGDEQTNNQPEPAENNSIECNESDIVPEQAEDTMSSASEAKSSVSKSSVYIPRSINIGDTILSKGKSPRGVYTYKKKSRPGKENKFYPASKTKKTVKTENVMCDDVDKNQEEFKIFELQLGRADINRTTNLYNLGHKSNYIEKYKAFLKQRGLHFQEIFGHTPRKPEERAYVRRTNQQQAMKKRIDQHDFTVSASSKSNDADRLSDFKLPDIVPVPNGQTTKVSTRNEFSTSGYSSDLEEDGNGGRFSKSLPHYKHTGRGKLGDILTPRKMREMLETADPIKLENYFNVYT